ncbi:iron-containing alcohol dehydrogenase [Enterocloster lavalensis]|uniref:iron-containing alcohol dehydrogenase n=1 Tax=Enterocloster lavalensis TaxID=460384 RepID=UPI001D317422|nr:iron-containing alcohol dehydrogenase [Enterocloster lavalensis]MBS5603592.1 iron-containing alcohol dehydrogenase [Enterocloster asparagiformis]
MNNFEFYTPTRMIFGRGTHLQVGKIVKEYGFKKVLVHFGGASAKKTGLLDTVCSALEAEGIGYVQLGGVQANPTLSMAKKGIELCLAEKVDFVLAVGGGSVIDSAKCIADGAGSPGADVWKFFTKEAAPSGALPVGTILTLSASGSEMSASCVITNEENGLKRGFNSTTHRPLFSICNPELTYTVNRFQTGCGTVDIMMHTLERYMGGTTKETPLTDRIAEGLLKSVVEAGAVADQDPENYEARATLMWAGSLSHNDLTSAGRAFMMQVHQMEHELSGMYPQIAHGAGLSALWPSWARYVCAAWPERFAQYAVRVWNLEMNFENPMETALAGIKVTEDYFKSLDMPTNIRDLGVEPEKIDEMAEKCTNFGTRTLPGIKELGKTEMMEIYRMAMEA